MAFIPFPDGVLAIFEIGGVSFNWTNTLWFKLLELQNHDYQELADYLFDWHEAEVMPELYSGWELQKVTVYDMSEEGGAVYTSTQEPASGGIAGEPSPINGAMVVTLYTDRRGRSGRGRNFVTGFVEADIGATTVSNALRITNVDAAYTTLIDDIQLNTNYFWVVASRFTGGAAREEVLPLMISNVDVRNAKLGSQRRRIDRE
jgi:hypothetical protein